MTFTEPYRKQHGELLELAGQIGGCLNAEALKVDAGAVSQLLSSLAGKLNVHLAMEDNALYPRLMKSADTEVVATAQQYTEEMGGIKKVFGAYVNQWNNVAAIQTSPDEFITQTKDLFGALAQRIEKENTILYPMADKAG